MLSCLGPDTLAELRRVYARPCGHHRATHLPTCTTGVDMLMHNGFSQPVMYMEHITLSFASPERLLAELQELGCNLHPHVSTLRGRVWHTQLCAAGAGVGRRRWQNR